MCTPCCSNCEAHGWFFLVWRLLWCCDLPCVQRLHLLSFSEGSLCTCIVLTHDAQNFRWIRCCWFQVSLDSRNFPKMQAFGLFRGRMSSWCSFRCTCLDELESKSGLKILYLFFVAKCVYSMLFRLWGSWMILSGLEASLVLWFGSWQNGGVDYWSATVSLDSMLLISGLAGFNFFFKMQAFGLFRGRMSPWCSFRCTCLDELESKWDVNILHVSFWLRNVCIPCYSDCEAHGWFFLVWRLLWCCDLVHNKMVVLTTDQQQFRWIRCCWFQASLRALSAITAFEVQLAWHENF